MLGLRPQPQPTPSVSKSWAVDHRGGCSEGCDHKGTGKILLPKKRSDRLALLDTYIAKEESRSPEERFSKPNLAEVISVRDDLKANLDTRRTSRSRRKDSYAARAETLEALYDTLRMAGGLIVLKKLNRKVTPALEQWGIEVTKRQSKDKDANAAPVTNGTTTNATNGSETTTNGAETTPPANTSTNGSVDLNGAAEAMVNLGGQA